MDESERIVFLWILSMVDLILSGGIVSLVDAASCIAFLKTRLSEEPLNIPEYLAGNLSIIWSIIFVLITVTNAFFTIAWVTIAG